MTTRRVIIIFATFALLVSVTALWDASGDERDGDTASNVVASSGADAGPGAAPKKKGGGLFRKVMLLSVAGGLALALSEGLRKKVLDALFGAAEEFEYTATTTSSTPNGSSASSSTTSTTASA